MQTCRRWPHTARQADFTCDSEISSSACRLNRKTTTSPCQEQPSRLHEQLAQDSGRSLCRSVDKIYKSVLSGDLLGRSSQRSSWKGQGAGINRCSVCIMKHAIADVPGSPRTSGSTHQSGLQSSSDRSCASCCRAAFRGVRVLFVMACFQVTTIARLSVPAVVAPGLGLQYLVARFISFHSYKCPLRVSSGPRSPPALFAPVL